MQGRMGVSVLACFSACGVVLTYCTMEVSVTLVV